MLCSTYLGIKFWGSAVAGPGKTIQIKLQLDSASAGRLRGKKGQGIVYGQITARFQDALNALTDDEIKRLSLPQTDTKERTTVTVPVEVRTRLRRLSYELDIPIKDIICAVIKAHFS